MAVYAVSKGAALWVAVSAVVAGALWWRYKNTGSEIVLPDFSQWDIGGIDLGFTPLLTESTWLDDIVSNEPRGIRNNNPGNIRFDGVSQWRGMTGVDGGGFVKFDTPENGIRAMARVLGNYAARGADTIREIIDTWAPPTENNTAAYIAAVAKELGIGVDVAVTRTRWPQLIAAIIRHENGKQPYALATIQAGINAA